MKLCLILGDQLSRNAPALRSVSKQDRILMVECTSEATYVKHHKKKITFLFSAMRHFAQELRDDGYNVTYVTYDNPLNTGSLQGEVAREVDGHSISQVVVTSPGEYRLLAEMKDWTSTIGRPVEIMDDDRYLSTPSLFADWASGRKQLRMEYFYREMRRKYNILMDGAQPDGGKWNFDADNRKPLGSGVSVQDTHHSPMSRTTQDVITLVEKNFDDHFGDIAPFFYAVTRKDALCALDQFINGRLRFFGDYQDAMLQGEPWLFHSHIALYLNSGLLEPLECIQKAEHAYRCGHVPLNAAEGFIRQILGWREYVRGLYWLKMPEFKELNFLDANRPLPAFYWTGETKMNCLRQVVLETKENAYAHHIQRLMVLGNFALLAGLSPKEVNEWFLIVYADAYEWVELPNVSGMALFADGGVLASKPYAASGAYINKMSDYCKSCSYQVSKKNGPNACPFNYLYWDFLERNGDKLSGNPRLKMVYRTLDRMSAEKLGANKADSNRFLRALCDDEKV